MAKIIAIINQKGGVGKTTTAVNLGAGLTRLGKRVLLIDADAQANLTESLGIVRPDELEVTLTGIIWKIINDKEVDPEEGIIHLPEGMDLLPANIDLTGLEITLMSALNREMILKQYTESVRDGYDYILIDCMPSLSVLTLNALVCADSVLIPVNASFLSLKGLEVLFLVTGKIRKQMNRNLQIEGILITRFGARKNYEKDIRKILMEEYGDRIRIFDEVIPDTVRVAESSAVGKSIYEYDPDGNAAKAYMALSRKVAENE